MIKIKRESRANLGTGFGCTCVQTYYIIIKGVTQKPKARDGYRALGQSREKKAGKKNRKTVCKYHNRTGGKIRDDHGSTEEERVDT